MNNKDCTFGFLLGIGAGVAIGVLWAPQSGTALRRSLMAKTGETSTAIQDQAADLIDSAAGFVEKGRAGLARQQDGIKTAVEAGKKAYLQSVG